jgi:hypothetical protein
MLVVHVGHVRMRVGQGAMPMPVGVRLARWIVRLMGVLVMRIVHVRVRMIERLVGVTVLMMLGDVQPDA